VTKENDPAALHFMKSMYTREEYAEKDMNRGFFAHPSLGAPMFARWLNKSPEFERFLKHSLETDLAGGEVRIFVVGSAFGGTGASGFPAIAKRIREATNHNDGKRNEKVIISGLFYQPYFNFIPDPADPNITMETVGDTDYIIKKDESGNEISRKRAISYQDFLKAGKNAAVYYDENIFKCSEVMFDRVYSLGAPQECGILIPRNIYADEGEKQDNWPHMLELFGALAAKDFFEAETDGVRHSGEGSPWFGIGVGRENFSDIEWSDLPNSANLDKLLNKFLLLSYTYVPAVLNRFINMVDGRAVLRDCKGTYKKGNDNVKTLDFEVINREPFIKKGGFLNMQVGWGDDFSGKFGRLVELNNYFAEHAKWFAQLLHAFNPNETGRYGAPLFERLINAGLALDKANDSWDADMFQSLNPIIKELTGADDATTYTNVYNAAGETAISIGADTDQAIGELVRGTYEKLESYVK